VTYVRSLDGLRGASVSLVLLFHLGLLPAGWVGVQTFFVLSGYLITAILLGNRNLPVADYIVNFYWRRSLRIFPVLLLFIAAVTAVYAFAGVPASFSSDWPFVITYTANFARLREEDIGPTFVHLWSLAVEEQFYLLWPFVVYYSPEQTLKKIVIGIVVITPIVRLAFYIISYLAERDHVWIGRNIYCLPFTQFDAFATGAAIAIFRINVTSRIFYTVLGFTAGCGAAVLLHQHLSYRAAVKLSFGYAMFLQQDLGFVWGYSLLNILSGAAVAGAVSNIPPLRFLNNSILVRIGVVSYGIYVYHVPIINVFVHIPFPTILKWITCIGMVIVLSELSFRLLEKRILRLKTWRMATLKRIVS
jgi:peptidoglycan/LPS O-acetylase OafA/YrhL